MKFVLQLSMAALAGLATASPIIANKRASPLTIELTSVGNSAVKAVLTNTGSEDLKLLKTGTILDDKATEKVQVHNAKGKLAFNGVKLRVSTTGLAEEAFTPLAAGASMELDIEVAALHDLTEGGDFDLISNGALPYALANSTELAGAALPFSSNKLSIKVDGAKAAKVAPAIKTKRSDISSDCTGSELSATTTALGNCAKLASAAASAASTDTTLFNTYFKSSSNVDQVVQRLQAIAEECSSTTSGATTSSCTDSENACSSGVLAYTLPSQNLVVNCPLYFSDLTALSSTCHDQDQGSTTLHEMSHANGVFSPGTDDLGYGFAAATALSATDAENNADSYALFANAVFVGSSCGASSDSSGGDSSSSATPTTPSTSTEVPETSDTPSFPSETPSFPTGFPTGAPYPTGTGGFHTGTGGAAAPSFTFTPTFPTAIPSSTPEDPSEGSSNIDDWLEWINNWLGSQGSQSSRKDKSKKHNN